MTPVPAKKQKALKMGMLWIKRGEHWTVDFEQKDFKYKALNVGMLCIEQLGIAFEEKVLKWKPNRGSTDKECCSIREGSHRDRHTRVFHRLRGKFSFSQCFIAYIVYQNAYI